MLTPTGADCSDRSLEGVHGSVITRIDVILFEQDVENVAFNVSPSGIDMPHAKGRQGRVPPQLHIVAPQTDLSVHQLLRLGHHLGRQLEEGAPDARDVGHADTGLRRIGRAAIHEVLNQHLGPLGDVGHHGRPVS